MQVDAYNLVGVPAMTAVSGLILDDTSESLSTAHSLYLFDLEFQYFSRYTLYSIFPNYIPEV